MDHALGELATIKLGLVMSRPLDHDDQPMPKEFSRLAPGLSLPSSMLVHEVKQLWLAGALIQLKGDTRMV